MEPLKPIFPMIIFILIPLMPTALTLVVLRSMGHKWSLLWAAAVFVLSFSAMWVFFIGFDPWFWRYRLELIPGQRKTPA